MSEAVGDMGEANGAIKEATGDVRELIKENIREEAIEDIREEAIGDMKEHKEEAKEIGEILIIMQCLLSLNSLQTPTMKFKI
jgi:Sec-independent protein translocase protein TatA